jgi:hypothetical protein
MASTRNKNSPGDYQLEQKSNVGILDYRGLENYAVPQESMFPGDSLLTGRMGAMKLSNNFCDIESELRGIGSTNLVNPREPPRIELKYLRSLTMCDRGTLILPSDLEVEPNQRPSAFH